MVSLRSSQKLMSCQDYGLIISSTSISSSTQCQRYYSKASSLYKFISMLFALLKFYHTLSLTCFPNPFSSIYSSILFIFSLDRKSYMRSQLCFSLSSICTILLVMKSSWFTNFQRLEDIAQERGWNFWLQLSRYTLSLYILLSYEITLFDFHRGWIELPLPLYLLIKFFQFTRVGVENIQSKELFHIMSRESYPPVAKQSPLLLKATVLMGPLCPKRVQPCLPDLRSQTLIFPQVLTEFK